MNEMSTTRNSRFPTIDVTHKPKRLQRDNIIAAGTQAEVDNTSDNADDPFSCVPLHNVTLERAIQYYEANAEGQLNTLYSNTAKWLRTLLAIGVNTAAQAEKRIEQLQVEIQALVAKVKESEEPHIEVSTAEAEGEKNT